MRRKIMKIGMKHKKIMAAFAGAALISATMLPGVSAKAPDLSNQKEIHESTNKSKEDRQRRAGDPVRIVRNHAAAFGFDSIRDSFSLESSSDSKATVKVRSSGQTFKVDLKRVGKSWEITTIRGIGDSTRPATYTPAKYFTRNATLGVTDVTASYVLYNNLNLGDWTWNEPTYPKDMSFGLLMKNPLTDETTKQVPETVLSQMKNVDFSRQFVVYAHLGTVKSNGYGVAVERVVKNGDNVVVTLRTKSPRTASPTELSVRDAFITLDRTVLNVGRPTTITLYDQNGTKLIAYTISTAYAR